VSDAERITMNRLLLAEGERICKCCGGRFSLEAFSTYTRRGKIGYMVECKRCRKLLRADRYQRDPAFREQACRSSREYDRRNRQQVQAAQTARRKRKAFERVMGEL
jgi:hypothetical protein